MFRLQVPWSAGTCHRFRPAATCRAVPSSPVQGSKLQGSAFRTPHSALRVEGSMFSVRCSMFGVRIPDPTASESLATKERKENPASGASVPASRAVSSAVNRKSEIVNPPSDPIPQPHFCSLFSTFSFVLTPIRVHPCPSVVKEVPRLCALCVLSWLPSPSAPISVFQLFASPVPVPRVTCHSFLQSRRGRRRSFA